MIDNPAVCARSTTGPEIQLQLWLSEATAATLPAVDSLAAAGREHLPRHTPQRQQEWLVSRSMLHQCAPHSRTHSLSHSGGLAAVLFSATDAAIGVDLEVHRPRPWLHHAGLVFNATEVAAIRDTSPERAQAMFYALWTMKEALAKALGLALMQALTQCHFVPDDSDQWVGYAPTDQPWSTRVFTPRPGVTLATACVGSSHPLIQTRLWPQLQPADWPTSVSSTTLATGHPT